MLPPYEFNPFAQSFVPGFIPFLLFPLLCLLFEGANCWPSYGLFTAGASREICVLAKEEGSSSFA